LKEIEDNFKSFHRGNNHLEVGDLKACLYSLGEERSRSDIEEMAKKFGTANKLVYGQFFELMVQIFGDADTKDEIIAGLKLINRVPEGSPPVALKNKM